MIDIKCALHKQSMAIVNVANPTPGDQDVLLLCPVCDTIQSRLTALSGTIDILKGQLDDQKPKP